MVRKRHIALCLIPIALFISITYLFYHTAETDKKIDMLSNDLQSQSVELEKFTSDIESMASQNENLMQQYKDIMQKYEDIQNDIDAIIEGVQAHENCTETEPQNVSEDVPEATEEQTTSYETEPYEDNNYDEDYYGRLYIPNVQIDVALYGGIEQEICDREDSANLFTFGDFDGEYIADHNHQEFRKLFSVEKGMRGYIQLNNGDIINLECIDVLNGYNTGSAIVDENMNSDLDADYLMCTCRDGWENICICLWKVY